MTESMLIPLLKSYIAAESSEEVENVLMQLTAITGFEQELVFDAIHCQFPRLHDAVVYQLQQNGTLPNIKINFHLF